LFDVFTEQINDDDDDDDEDSVANWRYTALCIASRGKNERGS